MNAKFRIGIDVGGTFTDLVAFDEASGETFLSKLPSTPIDPSEGVINAFKHFQETNPGDIGVFVHASTVGTNLFLGQIGLNIPKGALVTTAGFKDVLEIGRQRRSELYNPFFERSKPLVEPHLRFTIDERVNYKGEVLKEVDKEAVKGLAQKISEEKVEAVAVVFLHSYINPEHEGLVKEILQEELPDTLIVASHEVDPEYREYERMSTTVVNSLLIPVISRYLERIDKGVAELGISAPFYVMQSNGGLATVEMASRIPVATIESGPATGVTACAYWSKMLGINNMLSFDMGGTTAKTGAVLDGMPQVVGEYEVGGRVHSGRTIKGSGYPVRFPFVDLAEVSGGGGTIAWIDQGNALRVGPISAGAEPGPACYGKSGEDPTVTDANLMLGRLNDKGFPGGIEIYPELAEKILMEKIGRPLGLSLEQAASGVIQIVNSHMMQALRLVSIERGYDPREFALLAFGGAGPMHAPFLADGLGIKSIYIPPNPGVFSAFGLILADFRNDLKRGIIRQALDIDLDWLDVMFADMEREAFAILQREGFTPEQSVMERKLDLRYFGQSYEITISMLNSLEAALNSFHQRHQDIYGYATDTEPVEVVNFHLVASGITSKPVFKRAELAGAAPSPDAMINKRRVFFDQTGWIEVPVYFRPALLLGNKIAEPTVIEQYDATTVVPPGWLASVDEFLNLCLRKEGA